MGVELLAGIITFRQYCWPQRAHQRREEKPVLPLLMYSRRLLPHHVAHRTRWAPRDWHDLLRGDLLESRRGAPPRLGLVLAALTAGMAAGGRVVGRLDMRIGFRWTALIRVSVFP